MDSPRKFDPFDSEARLPAENERGLIQRQYSTPTRMVSSQSNIISPRQNISRSVENINETSFDAAKSGLRSTGVKLIRSSKFTPVANGQPSPRDKQQAFFNRTKSRTYH